MAGKKNSILLAVQRLGFDARSKIRTLLILLGLMVVAVILSQGTFLQGRNLLNILNQNAILILIALAQFMVIVLGGIDLSVGAVMALSSVLVVKYQHFGVGGALVFALAAGAAVGALNAYLVIYRRLPTFIVTLATMEITYSVSKMISGGAAVYTSATGAQIDPGLLGFYKSTVLGISYPVMTCIAVIILLSLFLKTRWGCSIFAAGGNEAAAKLSGISTPRVKMSVHIMASLICAVGGILYVSRVEMGDPQTGDIQQIDSIAAVTIGGASLAGGTGTIIGSVLGVLILSVLSNIMSLIHVPTTIQPAIKGLAILAAVYFNTRGQAK